MTYLFLDAAVMEIYYSGKEENTSNVKLEVTPIFIEDNYERRICKKIK